jgi:hypothetical protein
MRDRRGVVYELRLLMDNAAAGGDSRLAATLAGAIDAEAARAPVGVWVHGWAREPVEAPLDDEALEEGRRLSLDDAVALALDSDAT